jgi:predicted helicase
MSKLLITKYHNQLHEILSAGGTRNETSITFAFANLLRAYAEKKNLQLVEQLRVEGRKGNTVIPDGTLKYFGGMKIGYWEAKDGKDKLDYEIDKKLNSDGYPDRNIIFEDTQTAVLIQEGAEVMRVSMREWNLLDDLLDRFINYEPSEVKEFNKALEQFKENVPDIVEGLRMLMEREAEANKNFREVRDLFLEIARGEINPEITPEDIREMIIQHILTEDIFTNVFADAEFHRSNNIARELENVIETFMTREVRKNYLEHIKSFYNAIRDAASGITDNHEKQKFLKTVYENFYKVYNPKGADKLGVVYTPNEIVRFMIDASDWLLEKHFGKSLSDKGVDILDPATGTGTFIAELIDKINIHNLEYKYEHELHANEVAILPYYIANLNIEYTYQQRVKAYKEFRNICFVDTLDNTAALIYSAQQFGLSYMTNENAQRIKDQNARRISVIIGNPPYNANQANFNDFNKNREYKEIDKRIKDTYVRYSTAQKTKVYDMYARFYRWSMDRIDKNGIICFITNNSFINARTFDGFRKSVQDEFDYAYIINFGGNIRELSGKDGIWMNEEHTIFGAAAAVGISVMWLIKKEDKDKEKRQCKIYYIHPSDIRATRKEKLDWIASLDSFESIPFERLNPDERNNWLTSENDFESFLPVMSKEAKAGKNDFALFQLYSLGVSTNRDEWITDLSSKQLREKMSFFISEYDKAKSPEESQSIKWSRNLNRRFLQNRKEKFDKQQIKSILYRPYFKKLIYFSDLFIDEKGNSKELFLQDNKTILCCYGERLDFCALATNHIPSLNFFSLEVAQAVSLYRYDANNERHDNITDWALNQFQTHYRSEPPAVAGGLIY